MLLDQIEREKKRRQMTFQVGLFGCDGMILAGDTRGSSLFTSVQTKFVFDSGMNLVVAMCGTQVAMRVARALVDKKWKGDRARGERLANKIWKEEHGERTPLADQMTQSLIAVLPQKRSMAQFHLRSATIVTAHDTGKLVSGVECPYASLPLERYYSPSLPISKLKKLAAITVWLTGEHVPQYVDGLEMIEFPDGKPPRIVAPGEINDLLAWAKNADSRIRDLLTAD